MKTVLVFRTSVEEVYQVNRLKPILDTLLDRDGKWNFDLEDCDHILRVETIHLDAGTIESRLKREGFYCAELDD